MVKKTDPETPEPLDSSVEEPTVSAEQAPEPPPSAEDVREAPEPPPYDTAPPPGPAPAGDFGQAAHRLNALRRTGPGPHRVIAGVSGGLGRHFDVDPLLFRILFVVLALFGGAGLVVYVAMWFLVPEDGAPETTFRVSDQWRPALIAGAIVLGIIALLDAPIGTHFDGGAIVFLALIAGLVYYFTRDRGTTPAAPTVPPSEALTPYQASYQDARRGATTSAAAPTGDGPVTTYAVAPVAPATYVRHDPRRRGPLLFWLTLALMALGIGSVAMVDVADTAVTPSAYPAVALAIIGMMLVVGAWYGRAGGLIFLGLITASVLGLVTAVEQTEHSSRVENPMSVAELSGEYNTLAGDFTLDLRDLSPEELAGKEIDINLGAGTIQVLLPDGVATRVSVDAGYASTNLFGVATPDREGLELTRANEPVLDSFDRPVDRLVIKVSLGAGHVEVSDD